MDTKSVDDILASHCAAELSRASTVPRPASKYTLLPRLVVSWLQRWWCSAVTHHHGLSSTWPRWTTTTTMLLLLCVPFLLALRSASALVSAFFTRLFPTSYSFFLAVIAITATIGRRIWSRRAPIDAWLLSRIWILATRAFILWWLACVVLNMWARWENGEEDVVWWIALRKRPLFLGHVSDVPTILHVGRGETGVGGHHHYSYDDLRASTNSDAVGGEIIAAATAAVSGNIIDGTTVGPLNLVRNALQPRNVRCRGWEVRNEGMGTGSSSSDGGGATLDQCRGCLGGEYSCCRCV